MPLSIEIVGIYPVPEAQEPCHLVEIVIRNAAPFLEFSEFTQPIEGAPRSEWQVPCFEHRVAAD